MLFKEIRSLVVRLLLSTPISVVNQSWEQALYSFRTVFSISITNLCTSHKNKKLLYILSFSISEFRPYEKTSCAIFYMQEYFPKTLEIKIRAKNTPQTEANQEKFTISSIFSQMESRDNDDTMYRYDRCIISSLSSKSAIFNEIV